jgi:3-hydroxybutyryl-CoA dehydratase
MGRYFEDFEVGDVFLTREREITIEDIRGFASLTGDDNPLHTNSESVVASPFGGVIAHGLLIESFAIGLIAELGIMEGTTVALLEASCRFQKPVRAGDSIHVVMSIADKRPTRRPDRGVLFRALEVVTQRGETAVESNLVSLMLRRGQPG